MSFPGSSLRSASSAEASRTKLLTFRLPAALPLQFLDQGAAPLHMLAHNCLSLLNSFASGFDPNLPINQSQNHFIACLQTKLSPEFGRYDNPATFCEPCT